MTDHHASSAADLDLRRRRIRYRAWKRGTREMDLVMGRFVDAEVATWSAPEIDEFERLIDELDGDLFAWMTGKAAIPSVYECGMFARMKAFHEKQGFSPT